MKAVALIVRRADVSRQDFRDHYEKVHAPLALPLLEGLQRYVRHHVREEIVGKAPFDCLTSFWWRDRTALEAVMARLESPAGEAIRRDEQSFMNRAANTFFATDERVVQGGDRIAAGDPTAAQIAILAKRPKGADRDDFLRGFEQQELAALLETAGSPSTCVQNRALATGAQEPAFDCVAQVSFERDRPDGDALRAWADGLVARGVRVLVVLVSEHETPIAREPDSG